MGKISSDGPRAAAIPIKTDNGWLLAGRNKGECNENKLHGNLSTVVHRPLF